jgi:MerR family transcriptional regulator/heat shock protein HspR
VTVDRYRIRITVRDDDTHWVSIHTLGYHPDLLAKLEELGIIELHGNYLHAAQVMRLRRFFRLRSSLGVNAPGAAIILDLLERIELLQEELRSLRKE